MVFFLLEQGFKVSSKMAFLEDSVYTVVSDKLSCDGLFTKNTII